MRLGYLQLSHWVTPSSSAKKSSSDCFSPQPSFLLTESGLLMAAKRLNSPLDDYCCCTEADESEFKIETT